MTDRRYRHYRRTLALLNALNADWLPTEPRGLLEDLAEDLLLSRSTDEEEVRHTRDNVELTIGELTAIGMLQRATAVELTRLLIATGPPLPASRGEMPLRAA